MYNVNYMHTRIAMSPYFAKARPTMVKHLSSYNYKPSTKNNKNAVKSDVKTGRI